MNVSSIVLSSGLLVSSLALGASSGQSDNRAGLSGIVRLKLAGNSLATYPFFEFVRAFNQGSTVEVAVDPFQYPGVVGQTANLYLVAHKTEAEWMTDPQLIDLRGKPQAVTFSRRGHH